MNCAWCNKNTDESESHGICAECMSKHFEIRLSTLYQQERTDDALAVRSRSRPIRRRGTLPVRILVL